MKKILVLASVAVMIAGVSQAALWNSAWSGATYSSVSESGADGGGGVLEITALESIYGTDTSGQGYYFRMTIAASDGKDVAYMLNFNTDGNLATGANAGNSTYVATGILGIDKIVDAHYDGGPYTGSHYHLFDGNLGDNILFSTTALTTVGGVFDIPGSTVLEWFVPTALLAQGTTVRGSIVDIGTTFGGANPTVTWDITDVLTTVPEPTSMALLALGLAVLGLRRKVRA